MNQITVKQMAEILAIEVRKGNGDKLLITGNDNEGNGYHGVFFGVSPITDDMIELIGDSCSLDKDKIVLIG